MVEDSQAPKDKAPSKLQLAYTKFVNRFKDKEPDYKEIKITPEELKAYEEKYKDTNPWEKVGFARPLGGLFYNLVFTLFGLVIGLVTAGFVISWLYPYPEARGYEGIVGTLFSLMFAMFDIGTAYGIERFVAEYRVKDPHKMLEYIQFFIWYQMFTGLVQTTVVSMMGLYVFVNSPFSYLIWLVLIKSTTQYPGMLGMFKATLDGLQKFNKTAILGFISGQGFQMVTNIIFILLGRWWGSQNPAIGELVGLAIGGAIGGYIDDFFAMWLSAWYFSKEMKVYGFSAKDCFRHDFSWRLAVSTMSFGLRTAFGPLIGTFVGFTIQMYYITLVPQYATWAALAGVASGIASLPTMSLSIPLTPAISESFLNGKKNLASFYIAQTWKYYGFFAVPFLVIIAVFLPVILTVALQIEGAENYVMAVPFLLPYVIRHMQQPPTSTADMIITGASRPTVLSIIRFLEEMGKLFFMTLWIVWLELPQKYGLQALIWIMPCGEMIPICAKTTVNWIYIHKKIVKVHLPWWQFLVAPLLAGLCMTGVCYLYLYYVWPGLMTSLVSVFNDETIGILVAGVLSVLLAIFGLLPFYIFMYGLFGGFDTFGLQTFKDAIRMSGPSKPFIGWILAFAFAGAKVSKLHNKFPIPSELPRKEAIELLILKDYTDEQNIAKAKEETPGTGAV
jgi:O-antigen/teichoic acid export membrane protein